MNTDYLVFKNFNSREEKICFWRQIVTFLIVLRKNVREFNSKKDFSNDELKFANALTFGSCHIRCYAIDYAIERHLAKETSEIIFDLCSIFENFHADRKSRRCTKRRLTDFRRNYPHLSEMLIFAWDASLTSCYSTDDFAWKYFFQRDRMRPWLHFDVNAFLDTNTRTPSPSFLHEQLTASQAQALEQLNWLYRAKNNNLAAGGITPKMHALLVGSSGSGKSFVANAFARKQNFEIFSISLASYLVQGSRGEIPTIRRIADWLDGIDRGVLFFDEIEKIRPKENGHEYSRYVIDEIMSILDARTEFLEGWNRDLTAKLKERVMIICAGAFQDLYEKQLGDVHFAEQMEELKLGDKIWQQEWLPPELIFRLSPAVIEIAPPTVKEISNRIIAAHRDLGIAQPSELQLTQTAQKILVSKQNLRGVEKYILDIWIEKQRVQL